MGHSYRGSESRRVLLIPSQRALLQTELEGGPLRDTLPSGTTSLCGAKGGVDPLCPQCPGQNTFLNLIALSER